MENKKNLFSSNPKKQKKSAKHYLSLKQTLINPNTPFCVLESYKTVRTNLQYSLAAKDVKIMLFSSAVPGEGKSTTTANIAVTLSQTDAKILLIDGDMRKPTQHKRFKLYNQVGLSSVLANLSSLDEVLQKDVQKNLDIIPSGPIPPNPSEMLGSKNMLDLLDILSSKYDYILIDTPPILIVPDALILAKPNIGTVIVAVQNSTTYIDLEKSIEDIKVTGSPFLGAVVTSVKEKEKNYYARNKYNYLSYKNKNYEYKD